MYILEKITMSEFERYLKETKTIVFPFGTIEEHGSHLPLNTDSLIVQEALLIASKRKKFFLAPLINYGVCTSTRNHPGTIGISADTLRRLTLDLVVDSYKKGLQNFVLISGHGGGLHMSALRESAEIIVERFLDIRIAVFTPYEGLYKELSEIIETPDDSHAGEIETSIVLYLYPELVKGSAPAEYPQMPKPFIVRDKLKYWPGGVWGDPQKATADKGKKAINLIADKIVSIIEEIESRAF